MNRRGFLTGALGLLAAPAIVRASSIMPISVAPAIPDPPELLRCTQYWVADRYGHYRRGSWTEVVDAWNSNRGILITPAKYG